MSSMVVFLMFVGALWVAPIVLTHRMGKRFGFTNSWLWGFFLGWIGFFILMARTTRRMTSRDGLEKAFGAKGMDMANRMLEPFEGTRKRCPECAEAVQEAAKVCKHCGHRFEAPSLSATSTP